jgi:hypothetical protein
MSNETNYMALADSLKQARAATSELAAQLRKLQDGARSARSRVLSACSGGVCSGDSAGAGSASGAGGSPANIARDAGASALSGALGSGLATAMRAALSGDFTRALQSMLGSVARGLATGVGRSAGGGLGAGLLSTLVGGGLSLLLGKLFTHRDSVRVDNVVRAEVLNFPQLASLDFASNPASRLFGARAIPRGPAFSVEVSYRGGAEDIVTAKVAQKLADLNAMQGLAR